MPIKEAVDFFAMGERHKSYPVEDEKGRVTAMVSRADVLRWAREGWKKDETLADLKSELVTAYADELTGVVADRMSETGASRIPVIARESGKLVGLVARRELLRVRAMAIREEKERESGLVPRG